MTSRSPRRASSAGKRRGRSPRRFRKAALLLGPLALLVGALGVLGLVLSVWSRRPGPHHGRRIALEWPVGLDSAQASRLLAERGIVDSEYLMRLYILTLGRVGKPWPGAHLLADRSTPRELLAQLARLPSRARVSVLIPEGFDHARLARRLEEQGVCSSASFLRTVWDKGRLGRLGIRGPSAEGYLFPATYELFIDSAPEALLDRFVAETRTRLRKLASRSDRNLAQQLAERRNWGEHEILTLASMIEKEAAVDDERPIIASVFFNRLDNPAFRPVRMLQSDPTAAYGCLVDVERTIPSCRVPSHRVTPEMLRDASNPYNTYRHAGLPPGPVCSPGEASLLAVLAPSATDFLYFVADGKGRHHFSSTFDGHQRAVAGAVE